jgi:hypothetical protein
MSGPNPLGSLTAYSRFVAELLERPTVQRSTLAVWSVGPYTGIAEGEVIFSQGIKLRMMEELDFEAGLITAYGYEVYRHGEKLYWYDDFPHPNDPDLASTFPHHKHVPPDIKHHRVPASDIHFDRPNLPELIAEIERRLTEEKEHVD